MKAQPHIGAVARALSVIALVAAVVGITSWQCLLRSIAVFSVTAASPDTHAGTPGLTGTGIQADGSQGHDVGLHAFTPSSNEKARLASRAPWPLRVARVRSQDRPGLQFQPLDGAAIVPPRPPRERAADCTPIVVSRADRCTQTAMHELAAELVGHRAANPVRGPPGRRVTST